MKTISKKHNSGQTFETSTFFFPTGGASGNLVKQMSQAIISEGTSVTLNCTYTSIGYPTPFWCAQYLNEALQFLLKETMENTKNSGARNVKDQNSPILKYSVRVLDSAVYYCLLRDAGPGA